MFRGYKAETKELLELAKDKKQKCSACKKIKHFDDFGACKGARNDKYCYCKLCANTKAKEGYARRGRNYLVEKGRMLKRQYGLTIDQFDQMLKDQRYMCLICDTELYGDRSTHTDHDHATGVVRGLLCTNCNRGIGRLQEDIKIMQRAIEYLTKAKAELAEQGRRP